MPDFESMTLDEIDAWNVAKKAEMAKLQQEYRASNAARHAKVQEAHLEEARRQMQLLADKSGRTLEEECEWWIGRLVPENGDPGRWIQAGLVLGRPEKGWRR